MGRPVGASGRPRQCITQTSTKVFAAGRSVHFVEFPPKHRESDRLWNRLPLVGVVTKPPQMPVAESGQGSEGARGFPASGVRQPPQMAGGDRRGDGPGIRPGIGPGIGAWCPPWLMRRGRGGSPEKTLPNPTTKKARKKFIDPFFDFARCPNYFADLPVMGAIPRAQRPFFWGVASALEGPSIGYLFRIARPLTRHPSSQGKATDPWAFSRSASSASSATSSAGQHWLARSSGFRDSRSAGWGSRGVRTVERAGAVRAA